MFDNTIRSVLSFKRIVPPILQGFVGLGLGELFFRLALLQLVFLGAVSLDIADNLPHVLDVLVGVLVFILLRVTLQDVDDVPATLMACRSRSAELIHSSAPEFAPTVSPLPESPVQPEEVESSDLSHSSSSSAVMLTSSVGRVRHRQQ